MLDPKQQNIDTEVKELILTLDKLRRISKKGWVTWRKVAKEQKGAEEYHLKLSALAEIGKYKRFFVIPKEKDNVVTLSEEGIKYAQELQSTKVPISDLQQIVNSIVNYASNLDHIFLNVEDISYVKQIEGKYFHAVIIESNETLVTSGTPIEFTPRKYGGKPTRGTVVGQEPDGNVLYIAFTEELKLWESILPASIKIDRGLLLRPLVERIEALKEVPKIILPILNKRKTSTVAISDQNSVEVLNQLFEEKTPWSKLLWGPPGAGKTFGIGHFIKCLIQREPNSPILLIAPSNLAVDVALEQLIKHITNSELQEIIEQRRILRFGYPTKSQILERRELLGPYELDDLSDKVKSISTRIRKFQQEGKSDVEIALLRTELVAKQDEIRNSVNTHVNNCLILATTVTSAYIQDSPVLGRYWGTVIVDEVTMVPPAMCTFLASLAKERFLMAGDPQQLGPVYEEGRNNSEEAFEWMGRDIFDRSGISVGTGISRKIELQDSRLARITSQRRCAPEIWKKIRHLYPEVDELTNTDTLQKLAALPPQEGQPIVLVDTSTTTAPDNKCFNEKKSRSNNFTAKKAVQEAIKIASEILSLKETICISIGIITPYRAQVKLIKQHIREAQKIESISIDSVQIDVGTVHQFQGSEADIVIFDLVDGPGQTGIGTLLRGDSGIRLINVALTRAKGKFVIIANKNWCRKNLKPVDNPLLYELINGCRTNEVVTVPEIEESRSISESVKAVHILHLSDIHLGTTAQAQQYFTQLATDLTQNLNVKQLNYLVISGDIANCSTEEEYEAAFELVDKLVKHYGLDSNRIVIVPGNHDLNWGLSEDAYPFFPKSKLPNPLPERYIDLGKQGALICDEDKYKKRFDCFSDRFYKKIYNKPYPQEYDQQAILHPCPEDKILFLALNSCWEIDHEYTNRAGIHPNAIANALDQISTGNYNDWLKIAIWHHTVNGSESMKNTAFLEQLAVNGFQLGIHGHMHEAKDENFQYDTRRGLRIIAAGTFGAPAKEQVTGIPLQYNLLTLNPETGVLTVETRKKEKTDGAWSADARWGDKNNPLPRYIIQLQYGAGIKTDNFLSEPKALTQENHPRPQQSIFSNVQAGGHITVGSITQIYGSGTASQSTNPAENPLPKRSILMLASSPINQARLRLDKEAREIDLGLQRAQKREQFTLQQKPAVRPDDLRRALLDFKPQIVHFCGHGAGDAGLVLENDAGQAQLVPTTALANLFKIFATRGVQCVILNACYSEVQADAIAQHINYVIGMSDAVGDNAAMKFAVGFYDALGAGWSYEDAYEMGCNAIALEGIPEELTPVLKKKTS